MTASLSAPTAIALAAPARPPLVAAFASLMRRDLRVMRRELPFFLVRTLMQPVLFIVVFGYLLPTMGFVRADYASALLPGVLAVSLTLSSMQAVALPMVADFGWTREIDDRLLAPMPTWVLVAQKIVAGTVQGVVAAAVVLPIARLIMGPIPGLTLAHGLEVAIVTLLGAATFSAFGLWLGTTISAQQIGLMFSVILSPMLFFGCAYYPWAGLARVPVVQWAVLVNPLVYVAEGMRASLTPSMPHMRLPIVLVAQGVLLALFWTLGLRSFRRRAFS